MVRQNKGWFLIFFVFFALPSFAKSPAHLFIGISGGYGINSNAFENTGTDGLIRFAFGSLIPINSRLVIGDQIGFQTGTQIRLNNQITASIGNGIVPVLLNTKTPIDFLLVGRYILNEPLFFQAKAGAVFINSTVTGADVKTKNAILPDIQAGIGFNVYKRSRVTLSYQQFFGNTPIITAVNGNEGIYQLKGVPIWRGALLTFEHDL